MLARTASVIALAFAMLASPLARAADKAPDDVLKEKGLTKVNFTYLLPDDAKLAESLRQMRLAKKTLDDDTKKRVDLEKKIKMAKGSIATWEFEFRNLNEKLAGAKDVFENNKIVGQLNALQSKIKEGTQIQKDWEGELRKTGESRDAYVGVVLETSEKLETLQKQYDAINADPDVKAAVAAINEKARPKIKIGPSPEMVQNLAFVRQQRQGINSAVVKVNNEGNVPHVDVTFNGKVTRSLVLDSGASVVSLTADTAKALGMTPGPNDPTMRLQLADGKVVEAKQMVIKSVRVGQFVVENVDCAVLPESLIAADNLLGGSFLRNFVYKLDPEAGELHMSQVGGKVNPLDPKAGNPAGGGPGNKKPAPAAGAGGDEMGRKPAAAGAKPKNPLE
jgi:aspartyl protease family protein